MDKQKVQMWSESVEGKQLIRELSRDIVMQVAPEELDMFDELVLEYFQAPEAPNSSDREAEDALGFGFDETIVVFAPAAAAMVHTVLNHLTTELIQVVKDESLEVVRLKIKMLFRTEQKEVPAIVMGEKEVPPLTAEQLEQVKKLARKQAIKFGISPKNAENMANAIVGALALAK